MSETRMRRANGARVGRRELFVMLATAVVGLSACGAGKLPVSPAPPAIEIPCSAELEASGNKAGAIGLVIKCDLTVAAPGPYGVDAQIYQDRRRGAVAYANEHGVDISRSAMRRGQPLLGRALHAGPLPIRLWFPGSEIRVRGVQGEAWVDIQLSDSTRLLPIGKTNAAAHNPTFFRCRLPKLEPQKFVSRLPGQDEVPKLPKP